MNAIEVKNLNKEFKARVKEKLNEDATIFSMIEKETNEYIGNVEIMKIIENVGEIGITITPLKQNKHYGQEA